MGGELWDDIDGLDRFWRARGYEDVSRLEPEQQAKILPYIFDWIEKAKDFSGRDVYTGFAQIEAMRNAIHGAFKDVDFLISPTAPEPSYPAEWASPYNDPQRPFEHIAFTVSANMGGQPALSINCGYASNGLPIGMQIMEPLLIHLKMSEDEARARALLDRDLAYTVAHGPVDRRAGQRHGTREETASFGGVIAQEIDGFPHVAP
mgnify:CR=1 FL=1